MAYKIVVSTRARRQLVNAADYYHDISPVITIKFLSAIQEAYNKVSLNPYFQVRYRNVRAIPIKGFPYLLFFSINESKSEVKILSCFHTSRSPRRYP